MHGYQIDLNLIKNVELGITFLNLIKYAELKRIFHFNETVGSQRTRLSTLGRRRGRARNGPGGRKGVAKGRERAPGEILMRVGALWVGGLGGLDRAKKYQNPPGRHRQGRGSNGLAQGLG